MTFERAIFERAIPYGVADFKTIHGENYYYVDKTAFIAPMERRDRFIFFVRPTVSYVVELKHAKSDATDAELATLHAEALAQLKRYAAVPHLPALAAGTPVHFLVYEFKGRDLHRLEEIDTATGARIA